MDAVIYRAAVLECTVKHNPPAKIPNKYNPSQAWNAIALKGERILVGRSHPTRIIKGSGVFMLTGLAEDDGLSHHAKTIASFNRRIRLSCPESGRGADANLRQATRLQGVRAGDRKGEDAAVKDAPLLPRSNPPLVQKETLQSAADSDKYTHVHNGDRLQPAPPLAPWQYTPRPAWLPRLIVAWDGSPNPSPANPDYSR